MKTMLIAAAILGFAFASSASAAEMAMCDDATMMKVNDAIKMDTDPKMKDQVMMATEEMKKAEMAMKDNKMDDCSMHIGKAQEQLMTK